MTRVLFFMGALLMFSFLGCKQKAGGESETMINGGTEAKGINPTVFGILANRAQCSATKIAPRLLLTAGHCVLQDPGNPKGELKDKGENRGYRPGFTFETTNNLGDPKLVRTFTVLETKVFPKMTPGGGMAGDVAVVETTMPIEGKIALISKVEPKVNDPVFIFGVGRTFIGEVKDLQSPMRYGEGRVTARNGQLFYAKKSGSDLAIVNNGDSGGGVFRSLEAPWELLGVSIGAQDGRQGVGSVIANLSDPELNKWVKEMIDNSLKRAQ